MKQNIQMFQNSSSLWEKFLDWNPQVFREIKGKLKTRNVVITAVLAVITQFLVVISLLGQLPKPEIAGEPYYSQQGRYGMGNGYENSLTYTKDLLDNWVINWQLLWLDLFIILSVISIFALLIIGSYMLIADIVKEESQGTLNFIRLTPQSAGNILLGKILGVPILLYLGILAFVPLQLMAGVKAYIPLGLIFAFDAVIVFGCAFFYSLALLWSLINFPVSSFKPWLAGGLLAFFLFISTVALFHNPYLISNAPFDWLWLFHPALTLSYLIDTTYLPIHKTAFLSTEDLGELLFYGQALWTKASLGISFVVFNFSIGTYWCWSILKRRFHNPENTLLSKTQSYWVTGWLVAIALGFTLQSTSVSQLTDNFIILQLCLFILGLGLIAALSPHRQTLYDWARYRHQVSKDGKILWKELIFGENSPSTVAIAINLTLAIAYITPSIFLILNDDQQETFWGFILTATSILLYAVIAQLLLTMKTRKRSAWSVITISFIMLVPPLSLAFAGITPEALPQAWLFTFIPSVAMDYTCKSTIVFAILGQWLAISVLSFQMVRKLRQVGASETKMLFSRSVPLRGSNK
jgi:ABC-type Na+ efflux pump permease subunit